MSGDYAYMLLRTVLALALVVGVLAASLYGLRMVQGRWGGRPGALPVRVLSRAFIGQKSSIAVVEVAGQVLVLGIGQGSVSLLARLDGEEALGRFTGPSPGGRGAGSVSRRVMGVLRRRR